MTAKGILKIDPTKPFAELFGVAKEGEAQLVHIARILAVDPATDQVVAVFNHVEIRDGVKCGRPPGWGMPGGTARKDESPCDAIKAHEYGEIPWQLGEPVHLFSTRIKDRNNRLEQTHFFYVAVDRNSPTKFTPDEAREISHATFLDIEEIFSAPEVNTGSTNLEPRPGLGEFYPSHIGFFRLAWERYQSMKASGEIPAE